MNLWQSFTSSTRTAVRRLATDRISVTFAVVFAIIAGGVMLRSPERGDWFGCYVKAAERMQAGESIHRHETKAYAYPPAMAMMSVPLANLPYNASVFGFYAVNMVAAWVAFVSAWRLAGGSSLMQLVPVCRVVLLVTVALMGRYFLAPLQNLQFDMIIAALVFGGALSILQAHPRRGAVMIGIAAGMKCTPLLFAPYLIWRRQFTAAAILIAAAIVVNVIPDVVYPQTNGHSYITDWNEQFLSSVATRAPGDWYSAMQMNQSVSGTLNRWCAAGSEALGLDGSLLSGGALRLVVYGTCLALLAVTAWVTRYHLQPRDENTESPTQFAAEVAAACALMLLLSPMSSKAHYVILLLPCLLLVREAITRPGPGTIAWLVVLAIAGPLSSKGIVGRTGGEWALVAGLPTLYAATCWLGMLRMVRRSDEKTSLNQDHRDTPRRLAKAA